MNLAQKCPYPRDHSAAGTTLFEMPGQRTQPWTTNGLTIGDDYELHLMATGSKHLILLRLTELYRDGFVRMHWVRRQVEWLRLHCGTLTVRQIRFVQVDTESSPRHSEDAEPICRLTAAKRTNPSWNETRNSMSMSRTPRGTDRSRRQRFEIARNDQCGDGNRLEGQGRLRLRYISQVFFERCGPKEKAERDIYRLAGMRCFRWHGSCVSFERVGEFESRGGSALSGGNHAAVTAVRYGRNSLI
jgi:hypothetical protein